MSAQSRVAIVTGANKGIGLAIVRNLALRYPTSSLKSDAVKELSNDPQLNRAKVLAQDGGDTTITFHELDISQTQSIRAFRDFLKAQHPEGIDICVNNAGVAFQGFDSNIVKNTLQTNYYGTLEMTRDILPLLRPGGRLVNVSSKASQLGKYSDEIRDAFLQAAKTDVPAVTALMEKFQTAVAEGREKQAGFPSAGYAVSKSGETAFTKVIAMEEAKRDRGVLINVCCPGFVNTDMTRGSGVKTPDEGAQTPVLLALGDIGGKTGEFWYEEKVTTW